MDKNRSDKRANKKASTREMWPRHALKAVYRLAIFLPGTTFDYCLKKLLISNVDGGSAPCTVSKSGRRARRTRCSFRNCVTGRRNEAVALLFCNDARYFLCNFNEARVNNAPVAVSKNDVLCSSFNAIRFWSTFDDSLFMTTLNVEIWSIDKTEKWIKCISCWKCFYAFKEMCDFISW